MDRGLWRCSLPLWTSEVNVSPNDLLIIDCHTHIGRLPGVVGEAFYAEDLLHIAENEGVRYMLVSSATATTVSQRLATDEAIAMATSHPDRLGAMLWINPHDPNWQDDVDRAAQAGFLGIKLHPVLDHYAVTHEALDEIFGVAREYDWPILTHADADGTPMSSAQYVPLIEAYPDVVLILAHLRLEAIPLAKRHENVYLDTTYMDARRVELGVDAVGPSKIVFGTDACEGFDVGREVPRERPRRSYAGILAGYRQRGITDAQIETMCCTNAKALYKLPF